MKKLLLLSLLSLPALAQVCQFSVCISAPVPTLASSGDLNDAASGGAFTSAPANNVYVVTIYSTGTPDRFEWTVNGGTPPILHPTIVGGSCALPAAAGMNGWQNVADGVLICFLASTGHTLADYWTISTTANGTIAQQTFVQAGMGAAVTRNAQSKARETLGMLDYHYAVETDYAPAFTRAAAALSLVGGGTIRVPLPYAGANYPISGISIGGSTADHIVIECDRNVVLQHTGTGVAVAFGQVASSGYSTYGNGMKGCTISGGASTTVGLFLDSVALGNFENVRIMNVPSEVELQNVDGSVFTNLFVSSNLPGTATACTNGVTVDWDSSVGGSNSQGNTFHNLQIAGCSGDGLHLIHAVLNAFDGGSSESNTGTGVVLDSTTGNNSFSNFDAEVNTTADFSVSGNRNSFTNLLNPGTINVASAATGTAFYGGGVGSTVLNNAGSGTLEINTIFGTYNETGTPPIRMWAQLAGVGSLPNQFPATTTVAGLRSVVLDPSLDEAKLSFVGDTGGWNGSHGAYGTATITGCTNANPVVCTAAVAPPTSGAPIIVSGFTGSWIALNGVHSATNISGTTFSVPIDSTAFGAVAGSPLFAQFLGGFGCYGVANVLTGCYVGTYASAYQYWTPGGTVVNVPLSMASGEALTLQSGRIPAEHGLNTGSAATGITVSCTIAALLTPTTCTVTDPGHTHAQN